MRAYFYLKLCAVKDLEHQNTTSYPPSAVKIRLLSKDSDEDDEDDEDDDDANDAGIV